jgi:hypothetical protein
VRRTGILNVQLWPHKDEMGFCLFLGRGEFMTVELRSVRKYLGTAGTAGHLHTPADSFHKITRLAVSVRRRSP